MTRGYASITATLLTRARETIDEQLTGIKAYLESTGVGYRGSLVDREGYPLPDIDHIRITTERQRATRLLNDRKRIEYIAEVLAKGGPGGGNLGKELERLRPFAVVDEVFLNSPAEKADLRNGDFLIRFGGATNTREVASQIVEGQEVVLHVFRVTPTGEEVMDVSIIPGKWDGTGLVGAHLQPYPE